MSTTRAADEPDDLFRLYVRGRELLGFDDMDFGAYRRERAAAFASAPLYVLEVERALRAYLDEIDTPEDRARVQRIAAENDAAALREIARRMRPH